MLALTNIMGSQATREADGVLFTRAGLGDRRGGDQDARHAGGRLLLLALPWPGYAVR